MKAHDLDAVSLTFGGVFLGVVVVWLGVRLIDLELPSAGWLVAGALVILGVVGVVLTLVPLLNRSGKETGHDHRSGAVDGAHAGAAARAGRATASQEARLAGPPSGLRDGEPAAERHLVHHHAGRL